MLNPKTQQRELCYVVRIDAIEPITGSDNCEAAVVGGWRVMTRKGTFQPGNLAIYFEIDSQVPETKPFEFLKAKHYKIKTQRYTFGGKGNFVSQGLLMSAEDLGWIIFIDEDNVEKVYDPEHDIKYAEGAFLTKALGVIYATAEDNARKANSVDKYQRMAQRMGKKFSKQPYKWLLQHKFGKRILFLFYGQKKDKCTAWPDGKFPGVRKTNQERIENMPDCLQDKTPYIVTQKCDGSSGTYILEKKPFGRYEFYVCSRNVRMANEKQECYYGEHNYYWEVANKYNIKNKMKQWLKENPKASFICWQGEICAPGIQSNPHHLSETHFYCFHWTDSLNGRRDIRNAINDWQKFSMETVPIIEDNYVLPDDFEELKKSADGFYDPSVCEGQDNCPREGFVYYKTTDPTFSFKNVSREYLLKH